MKSKAKKLAKLIGGEYDKFGDDSSEWVILKTDTHEVGFYFDPDGELSEVSICKRVFVEDSPSLEARVVVKSEKVETPEKKKYDYSRYY